MGYVLNIHVDAIQIIFLYIFCNLGGQGFRVLQSVDSRSPVPVIAEKGNHLYSLIVHGFDKVWAQVIELQASVLPDIEITGGDRIQGVLCLVDVFHLLDIRARIQISHGIAICGSHGCDK